MVSEEKEFERERVREYIDSLSAALYKITKEVKQLQDEVNETRDRIFRETPRPMSPSEVYRDRVDREKVEILGRLCLTLMDKSYFPTNDSLKSFANSLDVPIPGRPSGRLSRNELVGVIIARVAGMPREEIGSLRKALDQILARAKARPISNFVREWEDVIRTVRIRR